MAEFRIHVSERALEEYASGRFQEPEAARLENHLAVCITCRRRLREEKAFGRAVRRALLREPLNIRHETADGPIHLEVAPAADGGWLARHWGRELDGRWQFDSLEEANEWNLRSFAEMYPEHRCTGRCQPLQK